MFASAGGAAIVPEPTLCGDDGVLTPETGGDDMDCPHCLAQVTPEFGEVPLTDSGGAALTNRDGAWQARSAACPTCGSLIVALRAVIPGREPRDFLVWPRSIARAPLPPELPDQFAGDFRESCAVLEVSPRASAALSRRCLQRLLREKAHVTPRDLNAEIDEVLTLRSLPPGLASLLDATRVLGKFLTHPLKSTACGMILPVEPGEAEWLLDVLAALFRFYFGPPTPLGQPSGGTERMATREPPTERSLCRAPALSGDC